MELPLKGGDGVVTCSLCASSLEPANRVKARPPCGHRVHYSCLRAEVLVCAGGVRDGELRCRVCGAEGEAGGYFDAEEVRLLHEEATPWWKGAEPTDLEFLTSTELILLRPVTHLRRVPRFVSCLEGLRCLDFTGHFISVLPPAIGMMTSLTRLVLLSCNISELPGEIGNLHSLEQLFIYGCHLKELPPELSRLRNLWRLCLDSNRLCKLPDSFPTAVDTLELAGNCLEELPSAIGECSRVREIRAYGNRLRKIPPAIFQLENLRDCCFMGNQIQALPEVLGPLRDLRFLGLSDNQLERLPNAVRDLTSLKWLYLYNNKLRELPRGLLWKLSNLERLFIEGNPLTDEAAADLLSEVPRRVTVGADVFQAASWHRMAGEKAVLPTNVIVGRMLSWGTLYAKLSPASQLQRSEGAPPILSIELKTNNAVLVVAFAASQAVPEWLGILGQLGTGEHFVEGARARFPRTPARSFADLYREAHGTPLQDGDGAALKASETMWRDFCRADTDAERDRMRASDGSARLKDFDVLCLCDTSVQWYRNDEGSCVDLGTRLQDLATHYERVVFLGVSMGGFGALLHAPLADTVAVFGPQTDLCRSHLRPGMGGAAEVEKLSASMRASVRTALAQGTRIQYHVALEDHLVYARLLPLPQSALVVHPVAGRVARLLERVGILAPLLVDMIAEVQESTCARPWPDSVSFAEAGYGEAACRGDEAAYGSATPPVAWNWSDACSRKLQVAKWEVYGGMSLVLTTPWELSLLSRSPPKPGDWFCARCGGRSEEDCIACRACPACFQTRNRVAQLGGSPGWRRHKCKSCGADHAAYTTSCPQCGEVLQPTCGHCGKRGLEGHSDEVTKLWHCVGCWAAFDKLNRDMHSQLPSRWYIDGGQRWSWMVDGVQSATIDFSRKGSLDTSLGTKGAWSVDGSDMEVSFGSPAVRWRLKRTSEGFIASPCQRDAGSEGGDAADVSISGRPLYGPPSLLDEIMRGA